MFLTRGYVQHHDTWQLWFRDVQGILPLSAMQVPRISYFVSYLLAAQLRFTACEPLAGCTPASVETMELYEVFILASGHSE